MRSLQSKLSTGLILSLIAVFSVLWLLISSSIQSLADEYIASRLRHDAETLLSTIHFDAAGNLTTIPQPASLWDASKSCATSYEDLIG